MPEPRDGTEIAVVGMAGRFPKAPTIAQFWRNLCDGVEGISFFSDQELEAFGVDPAALADPSFVKAGAILDGDDLFDAAFFGYSPREAELMDPQQRVFLECAWEALEHAGYDPETYKRPIGVYAGAAINTYLVYNLMANGEVVRLLYDLAVGDQLQIVIGNAGDFLTTRVSYKLNLKGPSHLIQSACSTSLVAVHLACQSLLYEECDMALAGGVSVNANQRAGYRYVRESLASPDGHCRAFDARGQGTIFGSGAGVVVLKRLDDALADGDAIHAIIRGSAINSDGSLKVGYTAPSVDGQAAVIAAALANAEVAPEAISYVEAHGTGTALGDPIEVQALTKAFRATTDKRGFCALGSVKTNVGHLDAAAGITSFIKTVLMIERGLIPPSLNFHDPNPNIDFADSPFYVNTRLTEWRADGPRRAGVSSFGIGGTNAHVVLEQAPPAQPSGPAREWQLLTISARSASALDAATANLAAHLRENPNESLADIAYTLQVGRRAFSHRRALICRDRADALAALDPLDAGRVATRVHERGARPVAFLFPGQGSQYVQMGRDLYDAEPVFRAQIDACTALLDPLLGFDIRRVLFPDADQADAAAQLLEQTWLTQPALFAVEYALAQQWIAWGVRPQAMLGHSVGEYVAATLAGVFSLEDALDLVAARGRIMQDLPEGAMLTVALPAEQAADELGPELSLAAINGPALCAVAGPGEAIEALRGRLAARGVEARRIRASHAFHSWMMDPILDQFAEQARQATLRPPRIPFISNVTGDWITDAQATDPRYWARHLRATVRFADGVRALMQKPERALLEVGPGRALTTLARAADERPADLTALASMRHPQDRQDDGAFLLQTLGRLWLAGVAVDWPGVYAGQRRLRTPLPTYPFERRRHWIEPDLHQGASAPRGTALRGKPARGDQLFLPFWRPAPLPPPAEGAQRWLIFAAARGWAEDLAERLTRRGHAVVRARAGERFAAIGERDYALNPARPDDYDALLAALDAQGRAPDRIALLWGGAASGDSAARDLDTLVDLARALGRRQDGAAQIVVVTSGAQSVAGEPLDNPEQAAALGACRAISDEYPSLVCRCVDLPLAGAGGWRAARMLDALAAELASGAPEPSVAYRGGQRLALDFAPVASEGARPAKLREAGVYLVVGSATGAGAALAAQLARADGASIALVENLAIPPPEAWERWLATHDQADPVAGAIRQAQALERMGATVLLDGADLADEGQARGLLARIDERFGALHGVIVADAGRPDGAAERLDRTARTLGALERALAGRSLDFCLIQSALATVTGRAGRLADAAAGSLADALVQRHNQTDPQPWTSVLWDARPGAEDDQAATLARLLALEGAARVAVAHGDLSARSAPAARAAAPRPRAAPEQHAAHLRPNMAGEYVAPATPAERRMAELWQDLLGIAPIGVHDDFFEAGGHSLLATQLVSRIRDVFHAELPLSSVFEAPTVARLAELVARAQPPASSAPDLSIPRTAHGGRAPLSYAQQRLWTLDWMQPGSPVYTMPTGVRLTGPLRIGALQRSLDAIIRRHETLRTTFAIVEGQPAQIIAPDGAARLPLLDLRGLPDPIRDAEAQRLTQAEARRAFDLGRGPLIRFTLLRLADQSHTLLLTIHHIIADFWSIGVLIGELTALYAALADGRPDPLPDLPIQYADYAIWQQEWLRGGELEAQLAYWRRQLAGAPALRLPLDRPRPPVQTYQGAKQFFTLAPELRDALAALSRQEGSTLFMIALAAFMAVLRHATSQDDLVVGTDVANRTRSETEHLIGFFVNQLVLRADLASAQTFRDLLAQVRTTTLEAYAHQDVPFDQLVKALKIERDPGRTPLFQVKLTLQNVPVPSLAAAGLALQPIDIDNRTAKYDLLMNLEDSSSDLPSWLEYNTDVIDAARAAGIVEQFEIALRAAADQPDIPLRELADLLAQADRRRQEAQAQAFGQLRFQKLKQTRRQAIRAADPPAE